MTPSTTPAAHALLLRLAGRLPDGLLTELRYSLALDDLAGVARAVIRVSERFGVRVARADHVLLERILDTPGGAAGTRVAAEAPTAAQYRFRPIAGRDLPALDLTGDWSGSREFADTPVDSVDAALLNTIGRHAGVVGVWRTWRYSATEVDGAAKRVYLVELRDPLRPWAIAAEAAARLHGAGEPEAQVEVYGSRDPLPLYHLAARAGAALLWAATNIAVRLPGAYADPEPRVTVGQRPDHIDGPLHYLRTAPIVRESTCRARDIKQPNRGAVVPMTLRTDGYWVWPEAAAYYLDRHGAAPDPEFLAHLRGAGPPPEFVDGVALFRAALAARNLLGDTAIPQPSRDEKVAHRFAAIGPRTLRAGWWRMPQRLDLTDLSDYVGLHRMLLDPVDSAVVATVAALPGTAALWRAWRLPADQPTRHGARCYLVQLDSNAQLPPRRSHTPEEALAGQVNLAMVRAGEHNGLTGIYRSGKPLTATQSAVRAHGALLWTRRESPPLPGGPIGQILARVPSPFPLDEILEFRRESVAAQSRTPLAPFRDELRRNRSMTREVRRPPDSAHAPHLSPLTLPDPLPPGVLWPQARAGSTESRVPRRPLFVGGQTKADFDRTDLAAASAAATDALIRWWPAVAESWPDPRIIRRHWQIRKHRVRVVCTVRRELDDIEAGIRTLMRAVDLLAERGISTDNQGDYTVFDDVIDDHRAEMFGTVDRHDIAVSVGGGPQSAGRSTPLFQVCVSGRWRKLPAAVPTSWLAEVEYLPFAPAYPIEYLSRTIDSAPVAAFEEFRRPTTPLPPAPVGVAEFLANYRAAPTPDPLDPALGDGFHRRTFDLKEYLEKERSTRKATRRTGGGGSGGGGSETSSWFVGDLGTSQSSCGGGANCGGGGGGGGD
ncbi:hypothetical protein D5S18_09650 [Nocardia panacis]|uniref:Uncharacterized protein n=1 Tax=Nocardia panacis TaxID=2340916 RepID=A0A3A4KCY6_9NOCA|nr:hypothetical protein [Nocardia panacis]RJO76551.1 hypothetical protein D5S18_09650 [Nocardia panacis]